MVSVGQYVEHPWRFLHERSLGLASGDDGNGLQRLPGLVQSDVDKAGPWRQARIGADICAYGCVAIEGRSGG